MQESLFTVAKLEGFVPANHPLRPIQLLVNKALEGLKSLLNQIYSGTGRDSIAPEKLIRASSREGARLGCWRRQVGESQIHRASR